MNAPLRDGELLQADFPLLSLTQMHRLPAAFDRLSLLEAQERQCALFRRGNQFVAVLTDPQALGVQLWVEARAGDPVDWYLANPQDLGDWLAKQAEGKPSLGDLGNEKVGAGKTAGREENIAATVRSQDAGPVVSLVNTTIREALRLGASDIHLEAVPGGLVVRYRIDGVLETVGEVAGTELAEQAVSRLKVLAELDIAEHRIPQDGRFAVRLTDRRIDLRLSVMPSIHGEDAVLRLLDKRRLVAAGESLGLDRLGFAPADLAQIRALATQPYGMLLVTGPTGSGKTTTLYGALSEIHDGRDKIVTIEDPVEYELPGVLQIPVNDKKGLGFARGLRSILRHDPDKIMIGEIRDAETAEIAVQSALTGHLVLSTVHANHVFDIFSRFAHLGIDPHALTSALNGVWAQRLLRTVCPHCARPHVPTPRDLVALRLPPETTHRGTFRQGSGCEACRGTGYRGRRAVAEILALDDHLRTLIARRVPVAELKAAARERGTRSLRDAALQLACEGLTTLEEVVRVTLQD